MYISICSIYIQNCNILTTFIRIITIAHDFNESL